MYLKFNLLYFYPLLKSDLSNTFKYYNFPKFLINPQHLKYRRVQNKTLEVCFSMNLNDLLSYDSHTNGILPTHSVFISMLSIFFSSLNSLKCWISNLFPTDATTKLPKISTRNSKLHSLNST